MSRSVFSSQAKYAKADPLFERSQAIRENMLGPEHPEVAESLNDQDIGETGAIHQNFR